MGSTRSRVAIGVVALASLWLLGWPEGRGVPTSSAEEAKSSPPIWTVPEIGALPRARSHHGDLRPYRSRSCGSRQALCRQQSRLRQLPSPGRNEEVRHSAVRPVRKISPLQRSLGGADDHRGPAQCLHDAQAA
jgi:hypothetical protein